MAVMRMGGRSCVLVRNHWLACGGGSGLLSAATPTKGETEGGRAEEGGGQSGLWLACPGDFGILRSLRASIVVFSYPSPSSWSLVVFARPS